MCGPLISVAIGSVWGDPIPDGTFSSDRGPHVDPQAASGLGSGCRPAKKNCPGRRNCLLSTKSEVNLDLDQGALPNLIERISSMIKSPKLRPCELIMSPTLVNCCLQGDAGITGLCKLPVAALEDCL